MSRDDLPDCFDSCDCFDSFDLADLLHATGSDQQKAMQIDLQKKSPHCSLFHNTVSCHNPKSPKRQTDILISETTSSNTISSATPAKSYSRLQQKLLIKNHFKNYLQSNLNLADECQALVVYCQQLVQGMGQLKNIHWQKQGAATTTTKWPFLIIVISKQ